MASTTIQYRNKFENWLSKTGVKRSIIAEAFAIAMEMSENPFFWLLWKLSFDADCKENALSSLELTTDEFRTEEGLWLIPNELVRPLRNELRYQYQQKHKDFLAGYYSNEELYNAMDNDIILTAGICRKLYKYVKSTDGNHEKRSRVIFLISSTKQSFIFGALKELGFTDAEARVFYPKADVIASVFKEMVITEVEHETLYASLGKPMTTKPFAELGEMINTSTLHSVHVEDEEPQEEEVSSEDNEEEPAYRQLNAQVVLANIELFKQFFEIADKLDNVGIDPFDALEKEAEIETLISSLEALS